MSPRGYQDPAPDAAQPPMLHGQKLGQTRQGGAQLALVRHRAGQAISRHGHAHACMHIVLRGLYVEHSSAGTVVACPGDVVFKLPEVEHWNQFATLGAESLRFELDEPSSAPLILDAAGLQSAVNMGRLLRGSAGRTSGERVSPHVELLAILQQRFREPIELGALAAHIGVHRSHLTRQFTREFGCSPQTYIALKRAAWAAQEVASGAGSMAEIAASAGFADQSHCTRTFKRAFGAPPLRWQRGARS